MRGIINTLVFFQAIIQFVWFLILTIPLPGGLKIKLLNFIEKSPLVKKINTAQIFNVILVGLVFVESFFKEQVYHREVQGKAVKNLVDLNYMFIFQRNIYLSGICLFLVWANYRTVTLLRIYKKKKSELQQLQKNDKNNDKNKLNDNKKQDKKEQKQEAKKTAQPVDDATYQQQKDSKLKKND